MKRLLEGIIHLYISVRGFSFANSILEMYKKEGKRNTEEENTQTIDKLISYAHTHTNTHNVIRAYFSLMTCVVSGAHDGIFTILMVFAVVFSLVVVDYHQLI